MDYSLLVVKISLSKEEANYLFGKDHRKLTEKEFCKMAGIERHSFVQSIKPKEFNEVELSVKDGFKEEDENEENENINNKIDNQVEKIVENDKKFNDDPKIKCLRKYFFPSLKGDILYIMSIIDFFQLYNLQKNLETKVKQITKRVKANTISSLPPGEYKDRFIEFVKEKTNSEQYIKYIYDPNNENDF